MAGTDVYSNITIPAANWSDTVGYTPAAGSTPASVQVGGVAASDVVLSGSVSAAGNSVTMTFSSLGQTVQEQLSAVGDIIGGSLFTDSAGDYFLFSGNPLTAGQSYSEVSGFGFFSAAAGNAACFVAGTRIETRDGPVAIEDLQPGDQVRGLLRAARGGGFAPVIWTGRMQVACSRHPRPQDVWPVRVAAHAFGAGRPANDVWLSPDHAVYEQGVLVPVRLLLNDATITQQPVEQVTYWHLELAAHDVVLAEGLPSESYLDTGNRGAFSPGPGSGAARRSSVVPIDPGGGEELVSRIWHQLGCARLVTTDSELAAMRRRLREHARVAGWRETPDAGLYLTTQAGAPIPAEWNGTTATARVPPGTSVLRLHSRGTVPSRLGDGSTDCRRLGVAITRIQLEGHDLRLDDARLREGWHGMEQGWRWTDGAAAIPLTPMRRARTVEIHTAPMLPYWQQSPSAHAATRRAA